MRRPAIRAITVAALTVLAACDGGGEPAPSTVVTATSGPTTSAAPTTGGASPDATTGGPTTGPTTTAPTTEPSPPGPSDPRSVPLGSLLRPGTRPLRALYGDLDGNDTDDIVLASVQRKPPPGTAIAQAYLDVFLGTGDGEWPKAWEATGAAPPGDPAAPAFVLQPSLGVPPSQQLDFASILDMRGDGSSELALGVLNVGAGPGPLDVWVIGFGPEGPSNEFWEGTVQGGVLVTAGDELKLQTPSFEPSDPACCPSRIEHQTIGFDPEAGRVAVLERTFTPVA